MEQDAGGRADDQSDRVGNAVIDGDRLDIERTELGAQAFADGVLDDAAEHAMLFELDRDQSERQRRAVDGDRIVRVELHDQIGQPADVILVAVGEEDAEQTVESLGDVRVVAHDQVDAVQLRFGKLDPRVDDDHVSAELDERRVLADLAHAAHRADANSLVDRHTG